MPYAKDHKARTRQRIVQSAARLFADQGFAATSIDEIMLECNLTRGGFYAHFRSKRQLYAEAMAHLATHPSPGPTQPGGAPDDALATLFEACLRPAGMTGHGGKGWAFLATDATRPEPEVRAAYASALDALAQRLHRGAPGATCSDEAVLAATAMIVGAQALAQALDDAPHKTRLVEACRSHLDTLLDAPAAPVQPSFLWAADPPDERDAQRHRQPPASSLH